VHKAIGKRRLPQVKIVRDTDRNDASGKPRSRGFGFVEFMTTEHALEALRKLNNNPSIFTKQKRPIVQFAWRNALVIHSYEKKVERVKARHEQLRKAALLNDDLISVDSEGKEHVHGKPSAEHNKQKQQKRGKRGAEGEEGTNDKKKAKKEKKKSQQKRGQKGTEPNTSRQNQNQNQKEGAGKKAGRQPRRQDADSELDAIASEGLATGGGTKANQSRRSKRNKEDQSEAVFDTMVDKYRKKLEMKDMMDKWM